MDNKVKEKLIISILADDDKVGDILISILAEQKNKQKNRLDDAIRILGMAMLLNKQNSNVNQEIETKFPEWKNYVNLKSNDNNADTSINVIPGVPYINIDGN